MNCTKSNSPSLPCLPPGFSEKFVNNFAFYDFLSRPWGSLRWVADGTDGVRGGVSFLNNSHLASGRNWATRHGQQLCKNNLSSFPPSLSLSRSGSFIQRSPFLYLSAQKKRAPTHTLSHLVYYTYGINIVTSSHSASQQILACLHVSVCVFLLKEKLYTLVFIVPLKRIKIKYSFIKINLCNVIISAPD